MCAPVCVLPLPYRHLQELTYPQFCEALVRLAQHSFSAEPGLDKRLQLLVTQHLLPLLEPNAPQPPLATFMALPAFVQYFATIDPVLRLVFTAAVQHVKPHKLAQQPGASSAETPPPTSGHITVAGSTGLYLDPDLNGVGQALRDAPDDHKTHVLDVVVKDEVDFCTLSVRQLVLLLQQTGIIVVPEDAAKGARGVAAHVALQAVRHACFPTGTKVTV